MSRFFFIGFMGCGKSTIGQAFAEQNDYSFIDLDDLIEKEEGKTIAELFSAGGEDHFRIVERNYLQSLLYHENAVIATGGGTPCFFDNMHWMNHHGFTIYLQLSPSSLEDRLKNERLHRPVLKNVKEDELLSFITQKLKDREKFYHQANYVLKADELTVEDARNLLNELFFHQ